MMPKEVGRFISPSNFKEVPHLVAGVSTRLMGCSQPPYSSLNLGKHTADPPENISKNLQLLCTEVGISTEQLARAYQCHGDAIWQTAEAGYQENYDAIIATKPGVIAGVGVADCCPILLVDPKHKITAAIHAGWKGTVAKIAYQTANKMMEEYGSQPDEMLAWIGPCISLQHFEVGDEVAAQFEESEKEKHGLKYHVDLKKANFHQLSGLGIKNIEVSPYCTIEDNELFFSHRKENGTTGRMLAFVGFKL